jgi:hypothetical protein
VRTFISITNAIYKGYLSLALIQMSQLSLLLAINFFGIKILGKTDYSTYVVYFSMISIALNVISLNIDSILLKVGITEKVKLGKNLIFVIQFRFFLALVICLFLLIKLELDEVNSEFYPMVLIPTAAVFNVIWYARLENQFKLLTNLSLSIRFACIALLFLFPGMSILQFVSLSVISFVLPNLFYFVRVVKLLKLNLLVLPDIKQFSSLLGVSAVSTLIVMINSSKINIVAFMPNLGSAELIVFDSLLKFFSVTLLVVGNLNNLFVPIIFQKSYKLHEIIFYLISVSLPVIILISFLTSYYLVNVLHLDFNFFLIVLLNASVINLIVTGLVQEINFQPNRDYTAMFKTTALSLSIFLSILFFLNIHYGFVNSFIVAFFISNASETLRNGRIFLRLI